MSIPFGALEAAGWCGTRVTKEHRDVLFSSVSIDSRSVEPGALFVAIRGPRHDGHRFLDDALVAGARGLLVQADSGCSLPKGASVPILEVESSVRALGDLAQGHRSNFQGPVVAITGSSGKTTTKDMCTAVLSAQAPCLNTHGNLNNEFGLPLTLLRREAGDESAVVELGMNHRGEIARLAEIARPNVGLVTNIGTAHIEFLGSREAIAEEKGDLFGALSSDGVAVVNLEDPLVADQARRSHGSRVDYGFGSDADVLAANIRFEREPAAAFTFDLRRESEAEKVRVRGLGETTVINALAAAAAALAAGASLEAVGAGLEDYRPATGRMNTLLASDGTTVIDDSYNSNPQSLVAALETLAHRSETGRSFAVLGDMNELGERAPGEHRAAGRKTVELGIDFLFALGQYGEFATEAAIEAGMDPDHVLASADHDEITEAICLHAEAGDWILVKGSRGVHMERVVEALVPRENR